MAIVIINFLYFVVPNGLYMNIALLPSQALPFYLKVVCRGPTVSLWAEKLIFDLLHTSRRSSMMQVDLADGVQGRPGHCYIWHVCPSITVN